jgi:hypothetical protein
MENIESNEPKQDCSISGYTITCNTHGHAIESEIGSMVYNHPKCGCGIIDCNVTRINK